jgi:hypothetical protein
MTTLFLNLLQIYLSVGIGVGFSLIFITKGFDILCLLQDDNLFKNRRVLFGVVIVLLWPVFIWYSFDKDGE